MDGAGTNKKRSSSQRYEDIESLKKQLNDEPVHLQKRLVKLRKKNKKDKKKEKGDGALGMESYLFTSSFDVNHEYHLVPEEAA